MRGDWPTTGLSLDEWRQIFGWHPYHFWGMADTDVLAITAQCDAVVYGYAWQGDQIAGRYEISEAIARAEQLLLQELHYRPAPIYSETTLPWPAYGDNRFLRTGPVDATGRWLSVDLPEGEIRSIGTEARTLIGTANVTLSDPDDDGVFERFTALIATSVTDTTEIACYFQAADRLNGDSVSERYRIRPLDVSISGGIATIRGPAWLLVTPIQSEGFRLVSKNPSTAHVLATAFEVYRRYTNASSTDVTASQAVITWETYPCHGGGVAVDVRRALIAAACTIRQRLRKRSGDRVFATPGWVPRLLLSLRTIARAGHGARSIGVSAPSPIG